MAGAARMAAHIASSAGAKSVFAAALLLAAVNLTAEHALSRRSGEHGAGENCLNKKRPFAESRNDKDIECGWPKPT